MGKKSKSSETSFGLDKTSFANMPQEVTMRQFPKQSTFEEELDDTITGVDETCNHGKGQTKKFLSNQH